MRAETQQPAVAAAAATLVQREHGMGLHDPEGSHARALGPCNFCPICHPDGLLLQPLPAAPPPAAPARLPPRTGGLGFTSLADALQSYLTPRRRWAEAAGIPEPDPPPDGPPDGGSACATCGGFRRLRLTGVSIRHADFGQSVPCPQCPEGQALARRAARRAEQQEAFAGDVPALYRDRPLAEFPITRQSLGAYRRLLEWLEHLLDGSRKRMVYLCGDLSVGKTTLACGVLRAWEERTREHGKFITTNELLRRVKSGYRTGDSDEVIDEAQNTPFLVLDDLGTDPVSSHDTMRFFELINHRQTHLLPTVITSNYLLGDLAPQLHDPSDPPERISQGDRIAERLIESAQVIELVGPNLRDPDGLAAALHEATQHRQKEDERRRQTA